MRDAHADHEMSFKMKNPETGVYDKIFRVEVDGIAPLKKKHYDTLVNSTEPIMRSLRKLLQLVYSAENPILEDLGIKNLTKRQKEVITEIIETAKESIYYEKAFVNPVMKDYPFLPIGGFDASIGDLSKMDPVFFEFNLGTPSGLSNNIQLLEILRKQDPELFATIADRLPVDNTFKILKNVIDSNALKWTGNRDGISVVIGPGAANGAHPDVASISLFSGMPLVKPKDLYIDSSGSVRLNQRQGKNDPIVTGIYGRIEESFLLQSNEKSIPLIDPHYIDNAEIGKKLGLDLRPGAKYKFIKNSDDEIIDVAKNLDGEPIFEEITNAEKLGIDPTNPSIDNKSLVDALLAKKIYISNVGGRAIDDKRVFQIISETIAPHFNPKKVQIAHPPKTLTQSEYHLLYEAENFDQFVIKAPDMSGGEGVYLMVNLDKLKQLEVIEMVKSDPKRYIVQRFAEFTLLTSPEVDQATGKLSYGTIANDWRIFVMMDADGNVKAGPNSVLVRTAKVGSASTNTSLGGGYGLGIVLKESVSKTTKEKILPNPRHSNISNTSLIDLNNYLHDILYYLNDFDLLTIDDFKKLNLSDQHRNLIHILGRDNSPYITTIRNFEDGLISLDEFVSKTDRFIRGLRSDSLPIKGLSDYISNIVDTFKVSKKFQKYWKFMITERKLSNRVEIEYFSEPFETTEFVRDEIRYSKIVVGKYLTSSDPYVSKYLDKVHELGGEVHFIKQKNVTEGVWDSVPASPYFEIGQNGVPVIAIDLRQPNAIPALAHELEHFKDWKKLYNQLLDLNYTKLQAQKMANEKMITPEYVYSSEMRALKAEISVESSIKSDFNLAVRNRPSGDDDLKYVWRMKYPEVEGIRKVFQRSTGKEIDLAKKWMEDAIVFALVSRRVGLEKISLKADQLKTLGKLSTQEYQLLITKYNDMSYQPIFNFIFSPPGERDTINRFIGDDSLKSLLDLFWDTYGKINLDQFKLSMDDLKILRGDFQRPTNSELTTLSGSQQQQ